jgi:formiminotetrahydrofolate cyclodeaminase
MPGEPRRTLHGYLDEVASGAPAPGGGSVVAIVGALAAALGEMVANLTLGRAKFASTEDVLGPARDDLTRLRRTLMDAASADEAAYGAYRVASALPRGTESEKSARGGALATALIAATEVPLAVAKAAARVAEIMETVAKIGNPRVRADAALGALLAEAALRGALLNVRGNTAMMGDAERARQYQDEANRLEQVGSAAARRAFQMATEAS